MIKLLIREISDRLIQENFRRLENFINGGEPLLRGEWKFFELDLGTVTDLEVRHFLPFIPKDTIVTAIIGAATVTFDYANFTETHIIVTTSAPCVVRFFLGRYDERKN